MVCVCVACRRTHSIREYVGLFCCYVRCPLGCFGMSMFVIFNRLRCACVPQPPHDTHMRVHAAHVVTRRDKCNDYQAWQVFVVLRMLACISVAHRCLTDLDGMSTKRTAWLCGVSGFPGPSARFPCSNHGVLGKYEHSGSSHCVPPSVHVQHIRRGAMDGSLA